MPWQGFTGSTGSAVAKTSRSRGQTAPWSLAQEGKASPRRAASQPATLDSDRPRSAWVQRSGLDSSHKDWLCASSVQFQSLQSVQQIPWSIQHARLSDRFPCSATQWSKGQKSSTKGQGSPTFE